MISKWFSFILLLSLVACSGPEKKGAVIGQNMSDSEFEDIFNDYTLNDKKYSGFNQLYDVSATLVSSDLQAAILQKRSDIYLWDEQTAQEEREEMFQANTNSTKFILVLFTPNVRVNKLERHNSIWKTYLKVNGQRYTGKVNKIKGPLEKLTMIYPSHNRFSQVYEVVFDVPLSAAEDYDSEFIITSELGKTEFKYENGKAVK